MLKEKRSLVRVNSDHNGKRVKSVTNKVHDVQNSNLIILKGVGKMAEIIAGVAMSHSPLIMTNEAGCWEKGQRFLQTTKEMKKWLKDTWSRCDCIDF